MAQQIPVIFTSATLDTGVRPSVAFINSDSIFAAERYVPVSTRVEFATKRYVPVARKSHGACPWLVSCLQISFFFEDCH